MHEEENNKTVIELIVNKKGKTLIQFKIGMYINLYYEIGDLSLSSLKELKFIF